MAVTATDLSLVLSGGTNNLNPNLSLGGGPSSLRVSNNNLNNLFSDITPDESEAGKEDYRCLYFFNDGDDFVYNVQLWMQNQTEGGSDIQIGLQIQDEIQRITISGAVLTGGSFEITYENIPVSSSYNSDLGTWATDLQNNLRSITNDEGHQLLEDVVVSAQSVGSTVIFDISFAGQNAKRNHDSITISGNNLVPSVNITAATIQQGAPINTVAPTLEVDTTPPGGVSFFIPTEATPLSVPNLGPAEGFPIWFKRITVEGATALADDSFSMRIRMQSLR